MLHGREAEQARIDRLLADARAGRSGVLVLRGEAGIGKTALLDYAAAQGIPSVRSAGVESEAELPFAGLHLLVRPGMALVDTLPERQRAALLGAFGLGEREPGDRLLIGLAVLSLLAEEASEGPLLCLIDDAHWLDRASAETLLFAARRLDAEGVAMIFATRAGANDFPAPGLPELSVTALRQDAAAALVDADAPDLAPALRYRLLTEAGGNPLALRELPAVLAAESADSGPNPLPLTQRLQVAFHGRVSRLPAATRTLLLVAAAAGAAEIDPVLRAAATLGAGAADLQPAEDDGLVRADGRTLSFRHPLLRSAIYQGAPLAQRLAVHGALAATLTAGEDADLRAWHLASAATGPDEAIAAALAATADRALARNGYHGAVAAYERAAALSTDPAARVSRLVLAAETAGETGMYELADRLAERAAAQTADPLLAARLDLVRGLAEFGAGKRLPAHRRLVAAADAARREPQLAARILMVAVHTAWYLGADELDEVTRRLATLRLPEDDSLAHTTAYVLDGVHGRFRVDLRAAADAARATGADVRDLVQLCGVGLVVGQDERVAELADELVATCRDEGRIGPLPTLLFFRAEAEAFLGRPREALVVATEGARIAQDIGQDHWVGQLSAMLAYLAALNGREADCRAAAEHALAERFGGADAPGAAWAHAALGLLDLGLGRVDSAMARLESLTEEPSRHMVIGLRSLPDLVEAAVRLGDPGRAGDALDRLEALAADSRQDWVAALAARTRALLGPDAAAEDHFRASLELGGRPFERARTQLLYGEWLRRNRRKVDARTQLRPALETFERLDAAPWAERARVELGALGVGAAARAGSGVLAALTPQELQIVRLAAQGMTNRDIAAQLFLSPRTVGHHLYKAYPKLGVVSRGELAALPLDPD
ncbi:regulatory protein, luxR family [Nocardia amikacinitolerans]|uniref:helix-turn-helix transcriptional regulator n=1 Tax=Nocardia amikacinitolerans TaxID=756689 RepID=UPI0020A2AFF6|nr:helix-turn-helix transcriptional regulator [Nocardia amikacinitolerans]MCP2300226.1 regulatory protein, luxR family [Nocardia amikacinitolerans]